MRSDTKLYIKNYINYMPISITAESELQLWRKCTSLLSSCFSMTCQKREQKLMERGILDVLFISALRLQWDLTPWIVDSLVG